MRISELAKKAGCTVESIRFYENHDLIPRPPRTDSNYRIYGPGSPRSPAFYPSLPLS